MFEVNLEGKTAWVTGGSRGIGRSIALALAKAGCDVAITYRSSDTEAQSLAESIRSMGRKATTVKADATSEEQTKKAHATIVKELSEIDILINNAGIVADGLFSMLDSESWNTVINTNLLAPVYAIQSVLPHMISKRTGRIINISSAAAMKSGRGQANYAASKAGLEAMTRSLAVELGKRCITVNALAPGVVETDMSAEIRSMAGKEILDRQVVKRFGQPDEIAAWAVMLASDWSSFVTGQTLAIDGGLKMV